MNTNSASAVILPADFQQEQTQEVTLPRLDTVGHVLTEHGPLALMLLNQINFEAGREMMRRLNYDAKKRKGKTEQDIHPDTTAEDEFASVLPEDNTPMELAKCVGLVGASLVLASRIEVDDTSSWMKKEPFLRSPKQIITDQVDWIADKQTETRLAQAERFGLKLEASSIRAKMQGEVNERINTLFAETKSAVDAKAIMEMDTEKLVEYIEEAYDFTKDWADKLKTRVTNLFERNVKKLKEGGYADMDDVLILLAKSFEKKEI